MEIPIDLEIQDLERQMAALMAAKLRLEGAILFLQEKKKEKGAGNGHGLDRSEVPHVVGAS